MAKVDTAFREVQARVMCEAEPTGEIDRSAALDGWAAAFDREIEQTGDFATSVAAMTAHGCFDVHAVVERWILANPTDGVALAHAHPGLQEPVVLAVLEEASTLPDADAPTEPESHHERPSQGPGAGSSPDIAYFHNLLQGGIELVQIYEAFPEFRFVIDEAVGQHEAAAPVLSDAQSGPSRQDLNDEIRGIRQELQASRKPERRRWRRD